MKRIAPYLAIVLCALAAYGAILVNGAGFTTFDDVAAGTLQCCDFRPILSETYLFNRHFGGWMATNFLLHLLAGLGLYWLSGSLWASCLFVAHPMAADAVASVAGRSAILSALLILVAVAAWNGGKSGKYGGKSGKYGGKSGKYGGKSGIVFIGIGLAAIDALGRVPSRIWTITGAPEHSRYVVDYFSALTTYIIPRLFIPFGLSSDPEIHFYRWAAILGLALVCYMLPLAILPSRARLGTALILLSLVPYLAVPLPDVFLEHRAYLALAGVAILMAEFLPQPVLWVALGMFIATAHIRASVYRSPMTLADDAARQAPTKFRPHLNSGVIHYLYQDYPIAERELKIAIKLNPVEYARGDLIAVYLAQNKLKEASGLMAAYSLKGY